MTHPDDVAMLAEADEPCVGMGVTLKGWSDSRAGTIETLFEIGGDAAFTCTIDQHLPNGRYRTRPEGERHSFRRGEDGRWYEIWLNRDSGRWCKMRKGHRLTLGQRHSHTDPSF